MGCLGTYWWVYVWFCNFKYFENILRYVKIYCDMLGYAVIF